VWFEAYGDYMQKVEACGNHLQKAVIIETLIIRAGFQTAAASHEKKHPW